MLSGCVVYMGKVQYFTALGGFRVLKKTLESPYTTKVNYRDRTTRGTTRAEDNPSMPQRIITVQL